MAVEVVLKKVILFAVASMARGRADVNSRKKGVVAVLFLVIVGVFFYFYSQSGDSSIVDRGQRQFGLKGDRDVSESSSTVVGEEDTAIHCVNEYEAS